MDLNKLDNPEPSSGDSEPRKQPEQNIQTETRQVPHPEQQQHHHHQRGSPPTLESASTTTGQYTPQPPPAPAGASQSPVAPPAAYGYDAYGNPVNVAASYYPMPAYGAAPYPHPHPAYQQPMMYPVYPVGYAQQPPHSHSHSQSHSQPPPQPAAPQRSPQPNQSPPQSQPAAQIAPVVTQPSPAHQGDDYHSDEDDEGDSSRYFYTKRNHNRTYHTITAGSKLRQLKKKDGVPLWRKDIQYDFLHHVFTDTRKVFHNLQTKDPEKTFADIYVDAMAKSSKCSKVLRAKLQSDQQSGVNMAMVCLLVNIGRMNTTLNFFPEMKARLRTYHPIPSLQSFADQFAYKQLQDAPRLKSILKGACEDTGQPSTLEALASVEGFPKTNPINLIFLLASCEHRISSDFFIEPFDFFDLIMNTRVSSASRAQAFLWLMWAFLETDLSKEQLQKNPYGPGQEDGTKIPVLVGLTDEEISRENVDTPEERHFGLQMEKERGEYLDAGSDPRVLSKYNLPPHLVEAQQELLQRELSEHKKGKKHSTTGKSAAVIDINTPVKLKEKQEEEGEGGGVGVGDESSLADTNGSQQRAMSAGAMLRSLRSRDRLPNYSNNGAGDALVDTPLSSKTKRRSTKLSTPQASDANVPNGGGAATNGHAASKASKGRRGGKPGLAEIRQQKCAKEVNKMLIGKDRRRRRIRYTEGPVKQTWGIIKNLDPIYNSEDEAAMTAPMASAEETGKRKSAAKRDRVSTVGTTTVKEEESLAIPVINTARDDYGEESSAIASAFRRAGRWIRRWHLGEANGHVHVPKAEPTEDQDGNADDIGGEHHHHDDEHMQTDDEHDEAEPMTGVEPTPVSAESTVDQ